MEIIFTLLCDKSDGESFNKSQAVTRKPGKRLVYHMRKKWDGRKVPEISGIAVSGDYIINKYIYAKCADLYAKNTYTPRLSEVLEVQLHATIC